MDFGKTNKAFGKVRIAYQQREALHVHMKICIESAHIYEKDLKKQIQQFMKQHITCRNSLSWIYYNTFTICLLEFQRIPVAKFAGEYMEKTKPF